MSNFTHLHLHTQYSLLDGAIRVKDLFPRVLELGMDTVAVTDHGNMFGAVDLYTNAKKHGVKLIFGCETYVAATDRKDRTNRRSYHTVLLAKDMQGYKNLSYLNSMGYLEGFYYNPRIDKKLLAKHAKGLIGMSACLGGEIAQTLKAHGRAEAEKVALEYKNIFETGDFYLEMMGNGVPEQAELNDELQRMSKKLDIPLVATNDCHYVNRTDAHAHDVLLSIQTGSKMSDQNRLKHNVDSYYLKNLAQMEVDFKHVPEALENTVNIARRCNVELDLGKNVYLPTYKVPDGHDLESYLEKVVMDGLERRFTELTARGRVFDPDEYRERCRHELGVINHMNFPGYFLIVWDFINWAKEHGIPVGPGRGSGAGSCVAYAMRITDIDPLEFKLLFERFLNPERVSMPDFDIDFCMNRRDEVIGYVKDKYGKSHVGQIATFHQLKARGVIRDIARVMELPYSEADKLAKLVPDPVAGKTPPVREAIKQEPELKRLYDEDDKMRDLLDVAASLEGLNRHVGMHAAGVVIAETPLWDFVPCFKGQNDEIVTQFAMKEVEKAGLVKFDFLGLKTLTVIDTAVRLINAQRKAAGQEPFDIDKIDREDADVYQMIARGDTTGVFQLESSGFREILTKLKPDKLEDIVAAVALYRPGPLEGGMVDDFIERKHGRKKVVYPHPDLEGILKDTYGVIVYQEQVMQIAQVLAGYSLGGADLLRRAMGKKIKEVMGVEKVKFMDGALARGVDKKIADQVFELMAFFAGYGFNRSHSAAYGWITYQTAYLKWHYPHEFMAGLMSCDRDNTDNIVKFIAEARSMELTVERPDVNESASDFTVVQNPTGKVIRFGLGAVKGVGQGAVLAIINNREDEGPFTSIYDFCKRVDSQKANRRVIEALVKSGAFDGLEKHQDLVRSRVFAAIEPALGRGAQDQKDRRSGQTNLFARLEPTVQESSPSIGEVYPEEDEEWTPKQLLAFEKESLGFYISGHPLDRFLDVLAQHADARTIDFAAGEKSAGKVYKVGGVVSAYRERPTRKGDGKLAFFQLEDAMGQLEVMVFPKTFEKVRGTLISDEPLMCIGKVVDEGEGGQHAWKMLLEEAVPLSDFGDRFTRLDISLTETHVTRANLDAMAKILARYKGTCTTVLRLQLADHSETAMTLGDEWNASHGDELQARLDRLFGERVFKFS